MPAAVPQSPSKAYGALRAWARRTSTSFAELWAHGAPALPESAPAADRGTVYRLRHWPELPPAQKTAAVYRLLSVMSHRPVNRAWMLASSRLTPQQVDALLARLERQGALDAREIARLA